MRFGVFYEHQVPRPWGDDGRDEARVFAEAMEQAEFCDRHGFDSFWLVEHHFLEEYSHSSAPEVFLAAVSQRTERLRLGHGIMHSPAAINHPARQAERIATLDIVSGAGSSSAPARGRRPPSSTRSASTPRPSASCGTRASGSRFAA